MIDICIKCSKEKPIEEFVKSSSKKKGYIRKCKQCARKESIEYRVKHPNKWKKYEKSVKDKKKETHNRFIEYRKTLKCVDCGINEWYLLEFHHLDPSQKDIIVSRMCRNGYSWERIMNEVSKCIPLCCNCHRRRHWNKRNPKEEVLNMVDIL